MPKRSAAENAANAATDIDTKKVIIFETTKFNVLHKLADNLEISELEDNINNEDQIDGFGDKVKEIIQDIYEEFKDSLEPDQGKGQFVTALIRIFSILLNTKTNLISRIKKTIKTSAQHALDLWPEQKPQ